jgi:hypothetical protein
MKRDEVSATSSMLKDDADTPIGDTTGVTWAKTGVSARLPVRATRKIRILLWLSNRRLILTVANVEGQDDTPPSSNLYILQYFLDMGLFPTRWKIWDDHATIYRRYK